MKTVLRKVLFRLAVVLIRLSRLTGRRLEPLWLVAWFNSSSGRLPTLGEVFGLKRRRMPLRDCPLRSRKR